MNALSLLTLTSFWCLTKFPQFPVGGHPLFPAYGAVVEDGYSVRYNLLESSFLFTVLSYRSCPHTDSQLLGGKLEEALREMREAVTAAKSVNLNL